MEKNKKTKTKILEGIVVSDKMDKTIVVAVSHFTKNLKYGKFIKRTKRYKVHDSQNVHKVGEKVAIRETKPISKDKSFIVVS